MEYIVKTQSAPAGFHSSLFLRVEDEGVDIWKVFTTEVRGDLFVSVGRHGWSPTEQDSIDLLLSQVKKEVKSLRRHGDLRPSQVRRLDLLQGFLDTR